MTFKNWRRWRALRRRLVRTLVRPGLLVILACRVLLSTTPGGFLTGVVRERSGALLPDVEVRIQNELTGARQNTTSDEKGRFASSELIPGSYRITLRRSGFRTASYPGLTVETGQTRSEDFVIEILPLQQEITVQSSPGTIAPAVNGVSMSRQSAESALPANGRDLHSYYALAPGAVLTPASSNDGGQFTVNGQRPNTNTVRVDGLNANTSLAVSSLPGTYPGSSLPAMTAIGSTQGIASQEEIEQMEIRSSDFSPESGGRPGAQVLIQTRQGSNDFHGSAFGLLRPTALDSNDWFAQRYGVPLKASSLNGYGASLGGPLIRNRTFFFLTFEREHLDDTAMELMAVPSLQARTEANAGTVTLFNAFPNPNGPNLGAVMALATVPLEQQASVTSLSARLDQVLGDNARIFARYSDAPSSSLTRQLGDNDARLRFISATLGLTVSWLGAIQDVRVNFSRATDTSSWPPSVNEQDAFTTFPGQMPSSYSLPSGSLPSGLKVPGPIGAAALSIAGVGQVVSGVPESTYQNQWEGVYTASRRWGRHDLKFGADYMPLDHSTSANPDAGAISAVSTSVESLLAGTPLGITASSGISGIYHEQISIGSAFAQDTFHVSDRLSIIYGLRWELTPPTNSTFSESFITSFGTWAGPGTAANLSGLDAGLGKSTWSMNYRQLAPRFGIAYRFRGPALVLKAGGGLFYETALGSLINPVNLSPLNTWQFVPQNATASLPMPSDTISSPPPSLSLPRIWEWRASIDRDLGDRSGLSLAYVGSVGTRLVRLEGTVDSTTGLLQETYFTNQGVSQYQALQTQFRGNLTSNLFTLVSYTWGHSLDNGSQGSAVYLAQPGHPASLDWASSDFNIRQNVNASITYRTPSRFEGWQVWLNNWTLSSSVTGRTGFPFNVTMLDRSIGLGFSNTGRPNLVAGQPIWISDNSVPGGRELNPNAFQTADNDIDGNLGRNTLTGPGLFQLDASLRRKFRLFGRSSVETSASAFNLLNHASFSNPVGYLGSPLFGQSVSMQNLMMGSGNPTNGLAPMFQAGGPRTVEIGLKISF
jgi:hypothetical protein